MSIRSLPGIAVAAALFLAGCGGASGAGSTLGAACTAGASCANGVCLSSGFPDGRPERFPGGYCSSLCTGDADCGSGNRCIFGACHLGCAQSSGCARPGYQCVTSNGPGYCAAAASDGGALHDGNASELRHGG